MPLGGHTLLSMGVRLSTTHNRMGARHSWKMSREMCVPNQKHTCRMVSNRPTTNGRGAIPPETVMDQVPVMQPAQQVALARAGLGTDHREPSWELMALAVEGR